MKMTMKMKSHFEDKLHFDYNTVTHLHFHNLSLRSYFQTIHINKVWGKAVEMWYDSHETLSWGITL